MAKRRAVPSGRKSGRRITATLDAVELARGHDGFLRGKPEPALLFAAWSVGPTSARLLGRALRLLPVRTPFPCTTVPDEALLLRAASPPGHDRVALLVAALEVDAGTDVKWLYAALGDPDSVSVWFEDSPAPDPHGIAEAARAAPPPGASRPVRLLRGRVNVEDSCRADQWVGACLLVRPIGSAPTEERLRVVSADRRNDWTACLRLRT
ncbi:MAG: hypothetical protein HY907_06990 [Deltaproteobacteria bacterium]|nr:hypothetical protein [Deltaproteobacteria bacterium]